MRRYGEQTPPEPALATTNCGSGREDEASKLRVGRTQRWKLGKSLTDFQVWYVPSGDFRKLTVCSCAGLPVLV